MATPTLSSTSRRFTSAICTACRRRLLPAPAQQRTFSTTLGQSADDGLAGLSSAFTSGPNRRRTYKTPTEENSPFGKDGLSAILDGPIDSLISNEFASNLTASSRLNQNHRLHIYATKHNTHITFVQPAKAASQTASSGISGTSASASDQKKQIDVLLSLSAGNIGFRKAGRGSYDAAYQLGAFVLKQIQEKGMLRDIRNLEVVLRGFGAGREAVSKVLLGSEGRFIRGKITSVIDATRLKQGGTRSKKPRRLG